MSSKKRTSIIAGLTLAAGAILAASPAADAYPRGDIADLRAACTGRGGTFNSLPTNSWEKRYSCVSTHPSGWYDKNWYDGNGGHTYYCWRFPGESWTCYKW